MWRTFADIWRESMPLHLTEYIAHYRWEVCGQVRMVFSRKRTVPKKKVVSCWRQGLLRKRCVCSSTDFYLQVQKVKHWRGQRKSFFSHSNEHSLPEGPFWLEALLNDHGLLFNTFLRRARRRHLSLKSDNSCEQYIKDCKWKKVVRSSRLCHWTCRLKNVHSTRKRILRARRTHWQVPHVKCYRFFD